jgi:hypothetical protein
MQGRNLGRFDRLADGIVARLHLALAERRKVAQEAWGPVSIGSLQGAAC